MRRLSVLAVTVGVLAVSAGGRAIGAPASLASMTGDTPVVTVKKVVETEVCIYGGTSAGVAAAVQARRLGRRVALVTPGGRLGGMSISGLSLTDSGNRAAIGGIAREFYRRVRENYVRNYGSDSPQVRDSQDGFRFEPTVAEKVFVNNPRKT